MLHKIQSKGFRKVEGKTLNINKKILDDQKIIEVGSEIDHVKIDKENKPDFEKYKTLYKNTIDQKCIAEYGNCDNKKLWEDTAKELFLQSAEYLPVDKKATDELDKKIESKQLVEKPVSELTTDEYKGLENYIQQMVDNGHTIEQIASKVKEFLEKLDSKEYPMQK